MVQLVIEPVARLGIHARRPIHADQYQREIIKVSKTRDNFKLVMSPPFITFVCVKSPSANERSKSRPSAVGVRGVGNHSESYANLYVVVGLSIRLV